MTNSFPTEEELRRARSRLNRDRLSGNGTSVVTRQPVVPPPPAPEPVESPSFGSRLGGFVSRLTTPLVDLPDQTNPVLRFAEEGVEGLTSPLGIATTVLAPITGGTSLGLSGVGGAAARVGTRLGAEALLGAAASTASRKVGEALPADTNPYLKAALQVGAGAATGIAGTKVINKVLPSAADDVVRSVAQTAEQSLPADPVVEPLVAALKKAGEQLADPEVRRELARQRKLVLGGRLSKSVDAIDPNAAAREQIGQAASALTGRLPRLDFPELDLKPETIEGLYGRLAEGLRLGSTSPLSQLDVQDAKRGLDTILIEQSVPSQSEMQLLERVFGPQFTEAISSLKPYGPKEVLSDVINLPRAVLASVDLSFPLRQGVLAIGTDPTEWAKGAVKSAKAFADPGYAREIDSLVRGVTGTPEQKVISNLLQRWGTAVTGGATADEFFQAGRLGAKLFGKNEAGRAIQGSERSFQTAGNYLRWVNGQKITKQLAEQYGRAGDTFEEAVARIPWQEGKRLAETLNVITGRSGIKAIESGKWAPALNAAFFAPNFLASRFIAPTLLPRSIYRAVKEDPSLLLDPVRMYKSDPIMALQAKSLGGFVAQGAAGLALLKGAEQAGILPDFSINTDPRSSDFGKGKVGDTRFDFWGGYAPIVRTVARLASGQTVNSRGQVKDADRGEVIWDQFIRSKVAPIPGLLWDAKTGSNFIGDKVTADESGIESQAKDLLLPLFVQDVLEGFNENGIGGALSAAPSFIGVGVTNFQSTADIRDDVSQRLFGKPYAEISQAQRSVVSQDPKIVAKEREADLLPPDESFGSAINTINRERQQAEDIVIARLAGNQITRQEAADAIGELQLRNSAKREELVRQYGIETPPASSLLEQGLQQWRNLYALADWGASQGVRTGRVDWEKFGQLEADLFKTLTPEQRQFIEERHRADHSPVAQAFFDNREYISASPYYDVADAEFSRVKPRVQRIDPDIDSYGALLARLDNARTDDPALYRRLNAIAASVRTNVSKKRETLRRRDPKLDAALYTIGRTDKLMTPASKRLIG